MKIRKRNGAEETYRREKIERVIRLAFESVSTAERLDETEQLAAAIEGTLLSRGEEVIAVESIQDQVEAALMVAGHYEAAKSFILYRNERSRARAAREQLLVHFADRTALEATLKELQQEFPEEEYSLPQLTARFRSFSKNG